MARTNPLAILVAAAAAFVVGALWYSPLLFGDAYMALRGLSPDALSAATPPPGELMAEFVRCLVVAYVLARFVARLGVVDWIGAVRLAAWVWLGFQAMAVLGSVIHEHYSWRLFAIHAGDALAKTILVTVLLSLWQGRRLRSTREEKT